MKFQLCRKCVYRLLALLAVLVVLVVLLWPLTGRAGMSIAAGGGGVHTHSDANTGGGTLALSGSLTSTKACSPGYTRVSPNHCWRVGNNSVAWTPFAACTARDLAAEGVPSTATIVQLFLLWRVTSNNAIANRSGIVDFYSSLTCAAGPFVRLTQSAREFAAVAAGTVIHERSMMVSVPVTSGFIATLNESSGNGTAFISSYYVVGYFD